MLWALLKILGRLLVFLFALVVSVLLFLTVKPDIFGKWFDFKNGLRDEGRWILGVACGREVRNRE
jgi:hypothetical protein